MTMYRLKFYIGCMGVSSEQFRNVALLLEREFSGFTLYYAHGAWRGIREACNVYEVITDKLYPQPFLQRLGEVLGQTSGQDTVLITTEVIEEVIYAHS